MVKKLLLAVVEDYWKLAVSLGLLAIIVSLAVLVWAATLKRPETVRVFGQTVSCDRVNRDASQAGRAVGLLSAQVREAQDRCNEGALKGMLQDIGGLLLAVAVVWTAAWGYGGYRTDLAPA
jgi:hypothetical protein